jgi:manganese-dependent inorganic pyrophosphatase
MTHDPSVTYVIGHKNPDTDAICAAIGYADLLQRTRMPKALAARCGSITARTEWVLRKAGVPVPELVMDVRLTVGSICQKGIVSAAPHESFLEIYQRMLWGGYRSIPIVEGENQLNGMLSLTELLKLLLPVGESPERMRVVRTSLGSMERALDSKLWFADGNLDTERDFILMVAASSPEIIRDRIARFPHEQVVVVTGDRENIQHLAVESGVCCLVITGGFEMSPEIREAAREKGVAILTTRHDTASTIQFIRGSRRISEAVSKDFIRFESNVLVNSIQQEIRETSQALFPVIDHETGQLSGVFSRSDLIDLPRPQLILVDHNEFSQAVAGAEEANILEVIDHHRLSGNLVSKEPIRFINLPVGSTSTIVGRLFWDQGLIPSKSIATCLCAGLISDTLKLTSPTSTPEDKKLLDWLSKIAELNIDQFAKDFFAAGSVLNSCTPTEAVSSDRKEYEEAGYKVSISQIEELGLHHLWDSVPSLQEELRALIKQRGLDLACCMVTDIGQHFSVLLMEGPDPVLNRVDYPKRDHGIFEMDGVVSRKKQLFPWLSRLLAAVPRSA